MVNEVAPRKMPSTRLFITDTTTNIEYLIDTGADISIIPATAKQKLNKPDDYKLYTANSTTINTYGKKIETVNLGLRRKFVWEFLIANINKAIIGADFLTHYGLLVDLKNKKLIDTITKLKIDCISHDIHYEKISTLNSKQTVR